jgi:hypothetical protein
MSGADMDGLIEVLSYSLMDMMAKLPTEVVSELERPSEISPSGVY